MVERFAFPSANWKINPFGNWVRVSDFEKVEKQAHEAIASLEACRTLTATLRVDKEALRAENEQLRRERDAIRNETLEEAAKVAERQGSLVPLSTKQFRAYRNGCEHSASAIRNLKEPSDV